MGRAPCCSKVGLNRGPWTPEEDTLLSKYVEAHGEGNWRALPKAAGLLRCPKSCRLRWVNYLRPNVKRGNISEDEEDLIIMLHALLGNRWSLIAARMPGRTDNEIKNYWNTHLSKKLASKGLDPKTHKPIPSGSKAGAAVKKSSSSASSSSSSKLIKDVPSSPSSSSQEKQEAWETTMDLDTSSYSTGSLDYAPIAKHSKRYSPPNASKSPLLPPAPPPAANAQDGHQQHQEQQQANLDKPSFYCASPSSVLNFYSPTASSSDSQNNSSTSNCSLGEQQINSSLPDDPQQVLKFIDEFLCSNSNSNSSSSSKEVAEDMAGTEFWESLGRIEPPASDLWEGLDEFVMPTTSTSGLPSSQSTGILLQVSTHATTSSFPDDLFF